MQMLEENTIILEMPGIYTKEKCNMSVTSPQIDCNAIIAKVIENKIANMGDGISRTIKDQWKKYLTDSMMAFSRYLANATQKYGYVKTLLYRSAPRYLYDFFECCNLELGDEMVNAQDIDNLLDVSNFLIIQGTGGSGKSTMLKHFFLNTVSKKEFIPIFVELKDLNATNDSLFDCIYNTVARLGFDLEAQYLEHALKLGLLVILLDGYDELSSEKSAVFQKQLDSLCDKYPDNFFIISSRPNEKEFISFQRFTLLDTCPLSKEQAVSLVWKLDYDESVKNRFIEALQEELYQTHKSFASNPLLLTIMLLTYDNYADIPNKLHIFYSNAFETLYTKHDATKAGFRREMKSGLAYDDFKRVFARFCFITYVKGQLEFSYEELAKVLAEIKQRTADFNTKAYIDDLQDAVCVIYKDGLRYRFTHRSFQEYFVAVYLKEMTDENLSKAACALIDQENSRITYDNTFGMLYDMAPEKLEKERPKNEEKYVYYFRLLYFGVSMRNHSENGEESSWQLSVQIGMHGRAALLLDILLDKYDCVQRKIDCNHLAEIMKKNAKLQTNNRIDYTMEEILENQAVFDILKSAWLGFYVEKMCTWLDELYAKRKESERDLCSILDL